jgi:hypothetical protein
VTGSKFNTRYHFVMKTLFLYHFRLAMLASAILGLATHASAQIVLIDPFAGGPAREEAAGEAEPEAPAEEAPAKEKSLGQALMTMKFDRSPQALLAATRARRTSEEPTPEEAFQMAVMFGNWELIGAMLKELPEEDAVAGYTRLLDTLGEQSIPVGMVLKLPDRGSDEEDPYERNRRLQEERNQMKNKPAPLLSEDFYALVEASPTDLREENIPAIAKLVKTALGEGGRATLVSKLQQGWKGLGGESTEGRKLATLLLSSLGWIQDAAPFLPLEKDQWEDADSTQLVFAMEYFTQTGISNRDERQLQRAAELCAWLMKTARFGNYTRPQFRLAMDRLVQLLPVLEPEVAQQLIREQLFRQTATLADLISIIGELGQKAAEGNDLQARSASLGTQHLILQALVAKEDELPPNTAVLVMNWLTEAEGCYRAGGAVATEMTQAERMMMRRYGMSRQAEVNSLPTERILATAPPLELLPRLNPGLAQRVQLTLLKVNVLQPDETDLTLLRDYVKKHPSLAREVCQDVLAGWVSKRTKPAESEQVKRMRAYGMYVPPQMLQSGSGIPLTRLRQNQNIQQFKNLLESLREISPEPLDASLIVQAFMTLHSGAEVYQLDDIVTIFGPPEEMVRAELLDLLGGMRARLGEQWRDPATQQAAATNRTEDEAKDEVSRGYRTALELAKRGIREEDADWSSFIARGQLFFDASQYEFDRQIQLTEYVNLRDEAFASFRKAAEIYAAQVPDLPRGQWTADPFQAWFFVMLGASDLAQLTSNPARSDPGLTAIGDAMRALPGDAADAHLGMFGKMLGDLFPRVPANVRQRFLSSGLRIIGEDHPAAAAATKSLDYYRELLDEIQLRVTVDGPTRVGHSQPFGAFIGLETTRQLLRESGGFGKYLQNQANQMQAMMGGGGGGSPRQNLRDDFSKNIHAALDETFEVVSLTFHDSSLKTIDLPREGWVETPMVYAVLRAKNPAVDRIPSIQLDMDFVDQPGQVVLPVMSQVQPLDATDPKVENRPCEELELILTMDEREWNDGALVIDIQARGRGVIPELADLFNYTRDGFELEIVDGKLLITEFVSDGKQRLPKADRNWQLTYRRKPDLNGEVMFPFPALLPAVVPASIEFKHYQDADLVTVDPAKAAAGVKLSSQGGNTRRYGVLLAAAVLAIAAFVWIIRRLKPAAAETARELAAPADPTPFSTVAFLHRIRREHSARLSAHDLDALNAQIDEIQSACFSGSQVPVLDLPSITSKWLGVARKSS